MVEDIREKLQRLARDIAKALPSVYLAGGTAIMFRHAHRISRDLDFFSESLGLATLESRLRRKFGERIIKIVHHSGGDNVDLFIGDVKVSLVRFPFPNLLPPKTEKGIRLASDLDILLNKIYAAGRRIETKDPIDIAFLLKTHPEWDKNFVREKFREKFKEEKFEIYFAAALSFEDYPELDETSKEFLRHWYGAY